MMWCPGLPFVPTIPNTIVTDLEKATGKYTVLSAAALPNSMRNPLLKSGMLLHIPLKKNNYSSSGCLKPFCVNTWVSLVGLHNISRTI